jgi:hypothetical protein
MKRTLALALLGLLAVAALVEGVLCELEPLPWNEVHEDAF